MVTREPLVAALALIMPALLHARPPEQAQTFRFADPMPGAPSVDSESLGLQMSKGDGFVVYHTWQKEGLARETSRVLSAMHRKAHGIVGVPLAGYGVLLVGSRRELPEPFQDAHWLNIDGIPSMVREAEENSLPLRDEQSAYLVFPLLVHESVDVGLKNAFFAGRLTEATVSSRWIIEGIADYCAYQAVLAYQETAFARAKKNYLKGLREVQPRKSALDLENPELWWPFPNALPDDVPHAYAAAHHVVAQLSRDRGDGWIRKALASLQAAGPFTSADFSRAASAATGADVGGMVKSLAVSEVIAFADAL